MAPQRIYVSGDKTLLFSVFSPAQWQLTHLLRETRISYTQLIQIGTDMFNNLPGVTGRTGDGNQLIN